MLPRLLRYGFYAVIFLAALLGSLYLSSKWIIRSEQEVVVPDLVGHDTVYALDLLTSLGLNIKVGGFMWSETVPKNFIASQEPAAGTRIKRDRDVRVIISRGSRIVSVPNLVASSLREAELVLSENGLRLGGICRVWSRRYPRNAVVAQRPLSLRQVERGQAVDLLVSQGPEPPALAMPELRQRPLEQAVQILARLNLKVGSVKEIYRPEEPLDSVIGQRPAPGYRVDSRDKIALVVNRIRYLRRPEAKFWWLTYLVPEGYFKREVALYQKLDGRVVLLYREIRPPAARVDWLVWGRSVQQLSLRVDGVPQKLTAAGFHWRPRLPLYYPGRAKISPGP